MQAGRPLSVKAYLEGYLADNPHLAKAAPLSGAGSQSSTFLSTGMGAARTMRRAEFDKLDASRKTTFIQSGGSIKD